MGEQSEAEIIKVVKSHNNIIRELSSKYSLKLIDLFKEFEQIIHTNNNSISYTTTEWRRLRGLRAVVLHYVFRWSWNRIGQKYNLKLLCDHIHLNDNAGEILEKLMKEFINEGSRSWDRV